MGIYEGIKDVAKVVQQADNVDLYKKLLDLSAQALDMQDELSRLRTENEELRYWNHILSKVFNTVKKASKIELEYCYCEWSNWIDVLCGIIQDINKMNFIPRITVHVYGNIEPPDLFLKYFCVVKEEYK